MVNKGVILNFGNMADMGAMFTLCYYFETFVMVTWYKQSEAMLCKQWGKECDAVLNLLW